MGSPLPGSVSNSAPPPSSSSFFFVFFLSFLCSDPEEQRNLKLNECLLVTDRIREAGRNDHQGSGKFESGKRNLNGNGGDASTSLMLSS